MTQIKTFGIAREMVGSAEASLSISDGATVQEIKQRLIEQHPTLATIGTFRLAVNQAFAQDGDQVQAGDEIAIIPPVSGG